MGLFIHKALVGIILGAILAAAQWYSPALLPWVVGWCIGVGMSNLRRDLRASVGNSQEPASQVPPSDLGTHE